LTVFASEGSSKTSSWQCTAARGEAFALVVFCVLTIWCEVLSTSLVGTCQLNVSSIRIAFESIPERQKQAVDTFGQNIQHNTSPNQTASANCHRSKTQSIKRNATNIKRQFRGLKGIILNAQRMVGGLCGVVLVLGFQCPALSFNKFDDIPTPLSLCGYLLM